MSGTPPGAGPQDTGGEDITEQVILDINSTQSSAGPIDKDPKVKIKVTKNAPRGVLFRGKKKK